MTMEKTSTWRCISYHLDMAPSQDASGKWRFSSGSPILKMFHVILVVTSQHPGARGPHPMYHLFFSTRDLAGKRSTRRKIWSCCRPGGLTWCNGSGDRWRLHSLKLTAFSHLKIGLKALKGKNRIPTIHFQVFLLLVSGRVVWNESLVRWLVGWRSAGLETYLLDGSEIPNLLLQPYHMGKWLGNP